MSILKLHKPKTKVITINKSKFKFIELSAKQYLDFLDNANAGDATKIAYFVAELISTNIVGEELTKEQLLDTFTLEELTDIGVKLIEAFVGVEEAGKPL